MLRVKDAVPEDLERILEIYRFAQDFMIQSGNPTQWGHVYPNPELIASDIRQKVCKVIFDETGIHGVFTLFDRPDPTYGKIEDGAWVNDAPYVTIHRVAGDGQVHGLFQCAADYGKSLCKNVRVDTHPDNLVMQRQITKNGFVRCGIIHVADGSPRIAYQWTAP